MPRSKRTRGWGWGWDAVDTGSQTRKWTRASTPAVLPLPPRPRPHPHPRPRLNLTPTCIMRSTNIVFHGCLVKKTNYTDVKTVSNAEAFLYSFTEITIDEGCNDLWERSCNSYRYKLIKLIYKCFHQR